MSFADTIQEAVRDFADNGYDSEARLEEWLARIQNAAQEELIPEAQVNDEIRRTLMAVYERLIERGGLLRVNQGVDKFVVARIKPELRDELNRRILASANLIKLNRDQAVRDTIQRFAGWATSVPPGGTDAVERRAITADTRKELSKLKFQVRRVSIDQGHKFAANLSQIVATAGSAIAMKWHQHYTRYPRDTHKQRNGQVFLIRDTWADEQGLVRPGRVGYLDDVTKPGEEVLCRCSGTFFYGLRQLPEDMITQRGREELDRVRRERAA